MRIGVISDIHSNLIALKAVLADMPEVDALVCAGDVVGYNPWPAECVDAMRGEPGRAGIEIRIAGLTSGVPTVMGNHDRMVIDGRNFRANHMARAGVEHAKRELSDTQRQWLEALPEERILFDDRVKIVHGHPDDPDHYTYPEEFSEDLLGGEDALIMGHTHVQYHETYGKGVILNPGSVGQPRDGNPRAAYALLDLDDLAVEERRVSYDVEGVQDAIADAGLPTKTGSRLSRGR